MKRICLVHAYQIDEYRNNPEQQLYGVRIKSANDFRFDRGVNSEQHRSPQRPYDEERKHEQPEAPLHTAVISVVHRLFLSTSCGVRQARRPAEILFARFAATYNL